MLTEANEFEVMGIEQAGLGVAIQDVVAWREVDPNFREPTRTMDRKIAPSPAAYFPATQEGWKDAVAYAWSKTSGKRNRGSGDSI